MGPSAPDRRDVLEFHRLASVGLPLYIKCVDKYEVDIWANGQRPCDHRALAISGQKPCQDLYKMLV